MPIDPNIALGVRPIEQPNMLGQLGQVMAIRQAQQGYESENALRDFYSQGGDTTTAEGRRKLMAASPITGMKLIGQQSEIAARDLGSTEKAIKLYKDQVGGVTDSASAASLMTAVYSNPLTRPFVESMAPLDKALAAIPNDPAALEQWKRGFGLTADKLFVDANTMASNQARIQAAGIGAAAGNRNATINEQKWAEEQKRQAEIDAIAGRGVAPQTNALASPSVNNLVTPPAAAQAPTAAPTTALPNDVYARIDAIDAEMAKYPINNPRSIPILQQLNQQRTQLLASAKQQYGGPLVTYETTDPVTNRPTLIQGQLNQRGRVGPVETEPVPLSTNASATGGESISSTVARPAPSAAVIKERQVAEKLPEAIAMNNDAIRKIDEMIGGVDANGKPLAGAKGKPHPGFGEAVGAGFGTSMIPGTQGKSFTIRHKEVLSQAFLDAFEALKGGGAITEKEGEKATAARTRMDLAQSEKEYMAAAREYQGVLKRGVENAKARIQRSGGTVPTTATPEATATPVIKSEAEYNALPSGATYIDPDGVSRRKR